MSVTQHITTTVLLPSDGNYTVDTHGGGREAGSHIRITFGTVTLALLNRRAMDCYAAAWLDGVAAETAHLLPEISDMQPEFRGPLYPVVAIKATGGDRAVGTFDRARRLIAVRIGYVTFLACDRPAISAHADMWRHVRQLGDLVLPETS